MKRRNVIILINMETYFKHFTISEVLHNCSRDEIADCVAYNFIESLLLLVQVLDMFRDYLGFPIYINSSYRDEAHNKRVNGSTTSQHMLGQAIDFRCPSLSIDSLIVHFKDYLENHILCDCIGQVIFYDTFIHIGLRNAGHKKRSYYDKRKCKNNH